MAAQAYDPFRPRHEPARAIYDAFNDEARHRKQRSVAEWTEAEIKTVHAAAVAGAASNGLCAPTIDDVRSAERYARGSVDYGAKWAYRLVEVMRAPAASRVA